MGLSKVRSVGGIGKPSPPVPLKIVQAMSDQGLKQVEEQEALIMPDECGFMEKKNDGGQWHGGCVLTDSYSPGTPHNNHTANFIRTALLSNLSTGVYPRGCRLVWHWSVDRTLEKMLGITQRYCKLLS